MDSWDNQHNSSERDNNTIHYSTNIQGMTIKYWRTLRIGYQDDSEWRLEEGEGHIFVCQLPSELLLSGNENLVTLINGTSSEKQGSLNLEPRPHIMTVF